MLLVMFSSDCFCVFGLLSFFLLPYTVCLGVYLLNRLKTIKTTVSVIGSGIYCLSIFSQYFCFYNLSFPSLYANKKNQNF